MGIVVDEKSHFEDQISWGWREVSEAKLAVLTENQDSISNTHMVAYNGL